MTSHMTSVRCVRQPGGKMKIFDKNISKNLVTEEDMQSSALKETSNGSLRQISFSNPAASRTTRPQSCPSEHITNVDTNALLDHTLKLKEWLNDKQVKLIQENTDQEAKQTKALYNAVLGIEETFGQDVADFLNYQKLLNTRKKEMLYNQWHRSVYQPIEKEIYKEMNGRGYSDLSKRKRELHKEYLEHVNKKGHVFLDTIAPEEYYPMSLHPVRPSLIVAQTDRLRDPLLSQHRARTAEERVIFRCITGQSYKDKDLVAMKLPALPFVPKARYGCNSKKWLEMPLGDIESAVRKSSRRRMRGDYNDSQFSLADWSKRYDNGLVDSEMNLQKRRPFAMEHMKSQIPIFSHDKVNCDS